MMKKNPLMSLWLSGANSAAASARGSWLAGLHRQQIAMTGEMTKQILRFWSGAWTFPSSRHGKAKTRR
jgi:hypothetical protein